MNSALLAGPNTSDRKWRKHPAPDPGRKPSGFHLADHVVDDGIGPVLGGARALAIAAFSRRACEGRRSPIAVKNVVPRWPACSARSRRPSCQLRTWPIWIRPGGIGEQARARSISRLSPSRVALKVSAWSQAALAISARSRRGRSGTWSSLKWRTPGEKGPAWC